MSLVKKQQLKEKFDKISSDYAAVLKAKAGADQKIVSDL